MRGHAGALREAPVADWTTERLLARVGPDVCGQVCGLAETFAAVGTAIGSLTGVRSQVRFQCARTGVGFAAQTAQVRLVVAGLATAGVADAAVFFVFEVDSQRFLRLHLELEVGLFVLLGTLWWGIVGTTGY